MLSSKGKVFIVYAAEKEELMMPWWVLRRTLQEDECFEGE